MDIMQKIRQGWLPFQKRKLGEGAWLILGCNIAGFSFFFSFYGFSVGPMYPSLPSSYPWLMINHGKYSLIIHSTFQSYFPAHALLRKRIIPTVRQTVNKHNIIKLSFWLNFRIDESNPSSLQNPLASLSSSQKEKKMDKEKTKERYLVFIPQLFSHQSILANS